MGFVLPRLDNEYMFEEMVLDYFRLIDLNAQKYGRRGQKQYGLDIVYMNEYQQLVGIQCKNYQSLSCNDIDLIIDAVGNFYINDGNTSIEIAKLIIATSSPRDVQIINHIVKKRQELNKDIDIIFWDDIVPRISTNDILLQKYYPEIYYSISNAFAVNNNTNTIDLNNMSIEDLRTVFNSSMQKYRVIEFLSKNLLLGIEDYLLIGADYFCIDMRTYLNYANLHQNSNMYKSIAEFVYLLEEYICCFSKFMHFNDVNYYNFDIGYEDINKVEKYVKKAKYNLNNSYLQINENCQLFI